jgi:AcrR family transcriptional regulator
MTRRSKRPQQPRSYNAPARAAGAKRTQLAILAAAKAMFEEHGWSGATIPLIAAMARVSPKTVEALYGTKARLLAETVTYAIRGDVEPVEMLQREHILEMEGVATADSMLELHAAHLRRVNERSAAIAFVVEQAARSSASVSELWARMNDNRLVGVRWASRTLFAKRGMDHLDAAQTEAIFLVAFDWGTYRVLTQSGDLSADDYEAWLKTYYERMLLRCRDQ